MSVTILEDSTKGVFYNQMYGKRHVFRVVAEISPSVERAEEGGADAEARKAARASLVYADDLTPADSPKDIFKE